MSLAYMNLAKVMAHRFVKCAECERSFDLAQVADAEEWCYGHDCEV